MNDQLQHPPTPAARRAIAPRAFTLIEAMILVTILGIVGLGAGIGLQSTIHTPKAVDNILAVNAAIVSAMEQMRANAISNFSGLAGYSDTVTINSVTYNRTVTVAALTAPDGSGATTDYKQITVQIGSQSMVCIVTQP
jgi:type II secretory pathway pseudopilin PulG